MTKRPMTAIEFMRAIQRYAVLIKAPDNTVARKLAAVSLQYSWDACKAKFPVYQDCLSPVLVGGFTQGSTVYPKVMPDGLVSVYGRAMRDKSMFGFVVVHELAHVVSDDDHGPDWARMAQTLGIDEYAYAEKEALGIPSGRFAWCDQVFKDYVQSLDFQLDPNEPAQLSARGIGVFA